GRTGDENATSSRSDLLDHLAKLGNCRRDADDFEIVARLQFQLLHLAPQTRRFQCAGADVDQAIGFERLLDEIVGAFADGGDGSLDGAVALDHHHRKIGMLALDEIEDLDSVETAPLQPDVENDKLRTTLAHGIKRGVAVRRHAGFKPLVVKDARNQIADVFLIVDDEDFRRYQRAVLAHSSLPGL